MFTHTGFLTHICLQKIVNKHWLLRCYKVKPADILVLKYFHKSYVLSPRVKRGRLLGEPLQVRRNLAPADADASAFAHTEGTGSWFAVI